MDLTATCFAAAGVTPVPDYPLDGVDLMPVLIDGTKEFERTLFWRMRHRAPAAPRRASHEAPRRPSTLPARDTAGEKVTLCSVATMLV
jgi:hypothetical protein